MSSDYICRDYNCNSCRHKIFISKQTVGNLFNRLFDQIEDRESGKYRCRLHDGIFNEHYVCRDYQNSFDSSYNLKSTSYWDEAYGCWRVLPEFRAYPPEYPANSCYYCRHNGGEASGRGCEGKLRCHRFTSVQITSPGAVRDCFEP